MNKSSSFKDSKNKILSSIKLIFVGILFSCIFTACEKQTCDYCLEEKYCDEYKILDTTRYICKDCMKNPSIAVSGNVVNHYKAEPLDPSLFGVGSTQYKQSLENQNNANNSEVAANPENSTPNTTNNNSDISPENNNNSNPDNNSNNNETNSSEDSQNSPDENNTNNNDNNTSNASGMSDITDRANSLLSNSGLRLVKSSDNNFDVQDQNGNNTGISFSFDSDNQGRPKLNVKSNSTSNSFTNTCIASALAFVNSTDIEGKGYEIFNNACQYGNYAKDNCRFYYMDDTDGDSMEVTFDISYQ